MTKPGGITADRGLLYAEACFETVRVISGAIFAWSAHVERLSVGLAAFGLQPPGGLLRQCLDAAAAIGPDAVVRLTVTGGVDGWGLLPKASRRPAVYVQARTFTPHKPPMLFSATWPLPLRERPAKFTADYAETLRGLQLIKQAGLAADAMPLICDEEFVYSAPAANLLLYRRGHWVTPAGGPVLPGVVRSTLLAAGCVKEACCPRAWLADCEAAALTNSTFFVLPVAAIDGRALPVSGPCFLPLYQALQRKRGVPLEMACG